MGKVLSFKPWVGKVQMSQTISEFIVIFPKNKLDQKMIDNHHPKPLRVISLKGKCMKLPSLNMDKVNVLKEI